MDESFRKIENQAVESANRLHLRRAMSSVKGTGYVWEKFRVQNGLCSFNNKAYYTHPRPHPGNVLRVYVVRFVIQELEAQNLL